MKLSVIIPVFNESSKVASLASLLNKRSQGHEIEIIFIDGESSDDTCDICRNLEPNVGLYYCKKRGRSFQMNMGAEKATGDVFYFLIVDTFPPDDFVTCIKNALDSETEAGSFKRVYDNPHWFFRISEFLGSFHFLNYPYGDQSLFMARGLFEKVGGYQGVEIMEDEKIVRALVRHTRFAMIQKPVVTSARKFEKYGYIKLHLVFLLITIMYRINFSEQTLIHVYKHFVK